MKLYRMFKLWWFWYVYLDQDELSHKLDYVYMVLNKSTQFLTSNIVQLITARQEIAHKLNLGIPISELADDINLIKKAEI